MQQNIWPHKPGTGISPSASIKGSNWTILAQQQQVLYPVQLEHLALTTGPTILQDGCPNLQITATVIIHASLNVASNQNDGLIPFYVTTVFFLVVSHVILVRNEQESEYHWVLVGAVTVV